MHIRTAGKAIVGAAAMATATWASVAFACTPAPRALSLLPESAAPGSEVVVQGQGVSGSEVEIRWNGATGKQIAVAKPDFSGAFSVPVQVPDVAPGVYSLSLVDNSASIGRIAFEVTGAPGSASVVPARQLWPSDSAVPASSSSHPATAGIVLLAAGVVALAGTSAVAVTRRRRVVAESRI